MKEKIKLAKQILFKDAKLLCINDDERRVYFQGARIMAHILFMVDLIGFKDQEIYYDLASEEVEKALDAKKSKANQS